MITKNCQACGKGFGFFHKKCICQVCSEGFCEKCLTTGHDYQNRGILTTHRLCAKCVTSLKNTPATPTNSGGNGGEMKFNPNAPTSTATKDPSQLDKQLEHMMEEQQLPLNVRERTRLLDVGTKWQLIRAYEQSLTLEKNEKNQPGYWVEKLQNPSSQIWKDPAKMQRFVNTIKSQSKTWCVQLLRDKGLSALLEGFHQTKSDEVKVFALKAINAIISTRAGLESFLALPAAIQPLVLYSLSAPNDCRFEIYEFLATAIGFSPEQGLPVVLEAITSTQCGRIPFKPFVDMLTAPQTSNGVRFKLLVLINAIVNSADMLEDRQRSRQLLRSADFVKALQWLLTEVNTHRATVDGAALGINRQNTPASPQVGSPQVVTAVNIPLDQARTHRATTVTAVGATAGNKIVDQSEIWEMIRVQIELYEHAEEDDSLDATRGGVDFGSIDQLLEYVRVHMSPHVGQYLLPLLQMICILPLDSQKGQTLWSAVLTVVKRVIGASQANEHLSLEELFSLTEQYAQQATMSVSDAIINEKTQLEKQVNSLREKIRELESRPQQQAAPVAVVTPPATTAPTDAPAPSSNKELQQAKAEMLGLRTQLSQATKELEALKAAGPAATTAVVPSGTGSPEQAEALQKALAQITSLQQEIERLKAAGPAAPAASGPSVATQDTTITINTPPPPCLPGFTPVPHQPRTIVIPAGQPLPGQPAGTAPPAATTGGTAAPAAPTSSIPQPPVLPGFKGAAGASPAAATSGTAPSSGGNCQPDGKPWPPVLPGFKAQPGNPNAGGAASSSTTSSSTPAAAAAPPQPVEPPVKLPYTRKPIKPKQKMRQLHWTKLEDKVIEQTIWFNLNDQKNVSLNLSELDSLFCQAAPKQPNADGPETTPGGAPKAPAKAQQITFVEGQRGQNMSIAVSRFKPLTFEQIRDAILQVDTKSLSLDTAVAMSKWLPTPEEVEAVSSYDGPIADLAPTDKFIMIVGKVPALDRRLDAFIFKQQYQTTYDELNTKLNSCYTVLKNLKESKALLRTLEYILAMGNYLNGGTNKGEAFGFQIAYINQLGNTRSCDNKTNLLQYFVPIFDKDPITANLSECFVGIEDAARTDLNQLTSDVSKFNAAINKINGLIKQLTAKPQPGDKFVDVMTPFVSECEPKGKALQASLQNVVAIAKDMATSYGEEPSKFGPTQIFQLYCDFSKQLTATRQELKRQQELKEKQEKMAVAAAQRAAAGGGKPPTGLPPGVGLGGGPGGKPGTGLEGADGMNALQLALAQRKDRPPVVPNRKPPTAEDEVATQVQGTLTGSDAGSVLAAIKARREERSQQQGSLGGQNKRRSVFGTQPEQKQ